ncbi:MAG: hypothetical protein ACVCEJ_10895 [Candidatus Izemoplasmataceae bacterium]
MKKLYVEKTEDIYKQIGGGLVLPFFDLLRGIPKHKTNSTKYYRSSYRIMILSLFSTSICLFFIAYQIVMDGIYALALSLFTAFLFSQFNNLRRVLYFGDNEYTKFCKKHLIRTVLQLLVYLAIGVYVYILYTSKR